MGSEAEVPDIYADGINVVVGPYGITLSFMRTDVPPPTIAGSTARPREAIQRPVVQVRVSRELAAAIARALPNLLNQPLPAPELRVGPSQPLPRQEDES